MSELENVNSTNTSAAKSAQTTLLLEPLEPLGKKSWRRALMNKKYLLLCFAIPAAVMFFLYAIMDAYPFGDGAVLVLDLNAQYIYFFEALRDFIFGDGSLIYSFERSLGGEFMGMFAYYLSSPLNILIALFPEDMMTEALYFLLVLKTGLCGLTFGIYLDRTKKSNPILITIFSMMYALCSYSIVMQNNIMWMDNMICLPLIMYGIEELIKHGKFKLFTIFLAIAVFSNYYIGYMMCIFTAAYFFYWYFAHTPEERNPHNIKNHFQKSFIRIAIFSAIALLAACIIILPAYYSLTFGKTDFSNPSYTIESKFDFLSMLSKLYLGSYDTVRPEGLPFIYCGMLTLLILPLYFIIPKIKIREKIAAGSMLMFFAFSFNVSLLDLIWHGFQKPNWLNYRYSFMLVAIMLVLAYTAFEHILEINYKYIILTGTFAVVLLFIMEALDLENMPAETAVWGSLAFILLYVALMRAVTLPKAFFDKTAMLVLAIFVVLEMFCNGLANLVGLDDDVLFSTRKSYRTFNDRVSPVVEQILASDSSFYRMEKTLHRRTNDNFALDIRGLSTSTSTLNADTIKFLNNLGLASKSHWSKYLGGTPALDALLGIKYVITEKDSKFTDMYEEMFVYNDDLIAYKNPYALSIAYGVSEDIADFDLNSSEYNSPFSRFNMLYAKIEGKSVAEKIFTAVPIKDTKTSNLTSVVTSGHRKYTKTDKNTAASITYTMDIESTDNIYMYFPSDYARVVDVYVNGSRFGTFFDNETFRIFDLGSYRVGTELRVELRLQKDDLYLDITGSMGYFCYLNEDNFKEVMSHIGTSQFNVEEYSDTSFKGTINVADGDNLILTTIPYDKGWVVTADGEEIETFEVLGNLTAFRLKTGEHELSLEYKPACLKYGTILSLGGVFIFTVLCVIDLILKKRNSQYSLIYKDAPALPLPDSAAFEPTVPQNDAPSNSKNGDEL